MSKGKVLVAMSGGVDSSVAAYLLLQQGYECIGVTMKLYDNDTAAPTKDTCCSLEDIEEARAVAFQLGIPYYVFNFQDTFREKVVDRFVEWYETGLTPNPCIDCNRYLKFDRLLQRALELKCDYIATGHYARVVQGERLGLSKGIDPKKDQSYVLYSLTQEQLAHTLFPLGGMTKEEVRALAAKAGLKTAQKGESQDICFVPSGDYVEFLERYTGHAYPEGDLLDTSGNVVGIHKGAIRYTIGQRKGLEVAFGAPRYVCGKDVVANTVTIGTRDDLAVNAVEVGDWNWIAQPAEEPLQAEAKLRYRQAAHACQLVPQPDGGVTLVFEEPQYGIAPGQAAVAYDGDRVLGGGTILRAR